MWEVWLDTHCGGRWSRIDYMFCDSVGRTVLLFLLSQSNRFDISTTRRLTNQWNGKLTWSCGWLRQSSAQLKRR